MPKPWIRLPLVLALMLAVSACSSMSWWPFGERAKLTDAAQVLAIYDIDGMLAQVAPIINDSLAANLPAEIGAAKRERLREVVQEVYDPTLLAAAAARRLLQRARAEERGAALAAAAAALDAPLPRRMVANEQAAATQEFARGFAAFLKQEADPAVEPRMRQMRQLNEATSLVDLQIAFNVGMLRGMLAARNAAAPTAKEISPENIERMIDSTRSALRPHLTQRLPVMLFYAHRDVSPADLAAYLALQGSPALDWANSALPDIIAQTLAGAAQRLPVRYKTLPEPASAGSKADPE